MAGPLVQTDPAVCFGLSAWGFGPFPLPGSFVWVCPHPQGAGYGGSTWTGPTPLPPFTAPPITVIGGYGGDPYGLGPYGSIDTQPPRVTAVISLNGYEIEVYFSEEMDTTNPLLTDPTSYTLLPITGAPLTVLSVTIGQMASAGGGALTVIVHHTGTTLGGTYTLKVDGPTDMNGYNVVPTWTPFLAKGDMVPYTITPLSGNELVFNFDHPMLPASQEPPIGTGILDLSSYSFTTTPSYPVPFVPLAVAHPYAGDPSKVWMKVKGMTSLLYTCNISPATAINYDGAVLPNLDPSFNGVEQYPGNGTSAIFAHKLILGRTPNVPYGWAFYDTSGRIVPTDSTFRMDFAFNAASAIYVPPLSAFPTPKVGQLLIEDGPAGTGVRVRITLQKNAGVSQINIRSGTFNLTLDTEWDSGLNTISLVRNSKADLYTVLFNGMPIMASPRSTFNEASTGIGAGATWTFFDEAYSIVGFQVIRLTFTSTLTVFSAAWNFQHNVLSQFTGSTALAGNYVLTQYGPLVKDWGDATPATKQDVAVYVCGVQVGVKEVNPYVGKIYPTYPIPFFDPLDPTADVRIDYKWLKSPIMEMAGLNVEGLVLNKFDRPMGRHEPPTGHGSQIQDATHPKGAPDIARFQMAVVLGPITRPAPRLIGWRYLGFEREYSALLNSPDTLRLNQSPYVAQEEDFAQLPQGESIAYEGLNVPTDVALGDLKWGLLGTDAGHVDINAGTYTLIDDESGPYEPSDFKVATYYRATDLSFPCSVYVVARFQIGTADNPLNTGDTNLLSPDGIFTGVSFGIHDDKHLYLVGALLINGLEHVGMLLNARQPQKVESWAIGPKTIGAILSPTEIQVTGSDAPVDFTTGSRFQILSGTQAGVYTATGVTRNCDGTMLISVSPSFPANPRLYGNKYPDVIFETFWSHLPSTYRLVVDPDQKTAVLSMSGLTTVKVLTLDGNATLLPPPADTTLSIMIPQESTGEVVWGSVSTWATNQSRWSFIRYGVMPDTTAIRGFTKTVLTEMQVLPEVNPDEWYPTQTFGYSKIDGSGDIMILGKDAANETLNYEFAYSRIEPFFMQGANLDVRAVFRVDQATLGAGDAEIVLNDGSRETCFGTILYTERPGYVDYRRILRLPVIRMAGILDPAQQDWDLLAGHTATIKTHESDLWLTQGAGQVAEYLGHLDTSGLLASEIGGQVLEARFAVNSYVGRADGVTGIKFSGDVGTLYHVVVRLKGGPTPTVQLVDLANTVVQEYPFNWADGQIHAYRVVSTLGGAVSVFIDDDLQLPTLDVTWFPGNSGSYSAIFGATNNIDGVIEANVQSMVEWRAFAYSTLPSATAHRTLGVWKGGDKLLLNNWEIPRTDSSTAPNSAEHGPVVVDMDWESPTEVRILYNPEWGITVYRPDWPLPPYFTPEIPGVPGTGFLTQTTEPSAGWINVETLELPRVPSTFGFVTFGAPEKRAITQQRWDWVRYNLFKYPLTDYRSPQHMVLNQFNVINSGELTKDVTLETVIVQTLDQYRVTLLPTHMYASSIYKIVDGTQIFTYEMWSFDTDTQTVTLGRDVDGNEYKFSSDHAAVTIVFNPSQTVTNTYLLNQPLLDGVENLNEGTPPVPMSQLMPSFMPGIEVAPNSLNPNDPLNQLEGTLTEPYQVVEYKTDPEALYESMEFMTITDGGDLNLIHYPCADWESLGLSGDIFWNMIKTPMQDAFDQGGGMPGDYLFASGGGYMGPVVDELGNVIGVAPLGGVLGPGSAILYPNFPSQGVKPGTDSGKVIQRTEWVFQLHAVMRFDHTSLGGSWEEVPLTETVPPPVDTLTYWHIAP